MSTVVLIRPGSTDFDQQNRIQGILDLPLNESGTQEIEQLAEKLEPFSLEVILCSPLESARSTARILGETLGVRVKELDELQNLNPGLWQGMRVDDIRQKHPRLYKQLQEAPDTICPPEGEMVSDAVERVRKVLQRPLKRYDALAIVAPEPLATLIRCVVTGQETESISPICETTVPERWEVLGTNGGAALSPNGGVALAPHGVVTPAPNGGPTPAAHGDAAAPLSVAAAKPSGDAESDTVVIVGRSIPAKEAKRNGK